MNLDEYRQLWTPRIEQELDARLPPAETEPAKLHESMRYSVLNGGKRLRPLLCIAVAEDLNGSADKAMLPGLGVEILHAYTLIHDDLPCMDDDALRRGRPTNHIQFGEAIALLAGDALLTLAFQWTAEARAPAPWPATQYTLELARLSGSRGTIGGQVADLESEGAEACAKTIAFIHDRKTAALMVAAMRMGAISASADGPILEAITDYGNHIGLAFQIVDDILDETASTEELGKPAGSDRENDKMTYVTLLGLESAREAAENHVMQALAALDHIGLEAPRLRMIAQFILNRSH